MTTADNTPPTATPPQHRVAAVAAAGAAFILTLGVLLYAYGPDDLWIAYVAGLGLAAAMFVGVGWRVSRRSGRATTAERALVGAGDERDTTVLTGAFAILGMVTLPTTGAAGIAVTLGAPAGPVLAVLLPVQALTGVLAFAVINRRR